MKILVLTLWCLVPLGLVAYHYGPGQAGLKLDAASEALGNATSKSASSEWKGAISSYEQALAKLPKENVSDARRIRLELAKARMEAAELPKAREELAALADELAQDPNAHAGLRDETLATLASSRFYMTYLMKLEGLPDSDWEPEIEAARQEQKLLVQRATESGDEKAAAKHADDLEASIRLARMEPEELYGKAIPKQCNCSSGKCNKPSPKSGNKKPQDARGASSGPPVDGQGS
ncbi:tetratricopeptide repeat protein [Luteolibacter flavescens]|uniref:Tetratricopeptide repeat protein n=1 Tax=Luteolibacter flavescens TaxID=1859460 RepID=A0ABT3FLZ4_9BACT|nr:tetratricopeptide repeat protein [Luteolibacter flavescens]MCW1884595.1 tetratricopeptide repeat protein [Luteolibacter flavescens]